MKNKISTMVLVGVSVLLPVVTFAAVNLGDTIGTVSKLINLVIPLILALAVLYFFLGVAQYMMKSGDEEARKKAINTMVMGIVAIFVMVSIWGIIAILQTTFSVGGASPVIPQVIQ